MWPFTRKKKHNVYKVTYIAGALIDADKAEFKLKHLQTMFVEADDLVDAQVAFVKKMMITPHVYIHRIEKVITIEI